MGKKIISFLVILCLVSITLTYNTMNVSALPSPDYIIDDFSGFSSYYDRDLVNSTLSES